MKTQKPLRQLLPEIKRQFERYNDQLQFDLELYQLHEGQVRKFVERALKAEIISTQAYNRAIKRIPNVNIAKKITDKLSKVYAQSPIRFASNQKELMEEFATDMCLNEVMSEANKWSNLSRRCAIEIYQEEGKQMLRVLPAHKFFVYSDSPKSPNKMTVFCKLLGREIKQQTTVVDRNGRRVTNEDDIRLVDIIACYTDDEFLIMDSDGHVRKDKMEEMGITSERNPFGVIPFVYINKSNTELIPYPNQTTFDMSVLIPKLLTDLNYAAQFLSHSIFWAKNADLQGIEFNPDTVVDLGETDGDGNDPEIGTIKPETDIDGVLKLISAQLSIYMSTEGLKSGSIGRLEAESATSGIAKIIDESDSTEARKEQMKTFRSAEPELWDKFAKIQRYWASTGKVENKQTLDEDFVKGFSIKFAEIKPLESEKEKYEKMKVARDLKLITKKQALKELYPNLPADQLEQRLEELEEELSKEKQEMMSMGLTPGFTQKAEQMEGGAATKAANRELNGRSEPK
jgi:transcriptional regulator NrdR family protein